MNMNALEVRSEIERGLNYAYCKHGKEPWGRHEFYAILKEEVDELWDNIKRNKPQSEVNAEAVQVAVVILRYLETYEDHFKCQIS